MEKWDVEVGGRRWVVGFIWWDLYGRVCRSGVQLPWLVPRRSAGMGEMCRRNKPMRTCA